MLRPTLLSLCLLTAAPSLTHAAQGSGASELAQRFAHALDCGPGKRDLNRHWCPVTRIGKDSFATPAQTTTYLGLSVTLRPNDEVRKAVLEHTEVAALHLGPTGVRLTSLRPSNEQEKQDMLPILLSIGNALKSGSSDSIAMSAGLNGFLTGESKKPGYPLRVGKDSAEYTGKLPAQIYRVQVQAGLFAYVVVETAPDGRFVSIFPVVPLKS